MSVVKLTTLDSNSIPRYTYNEELKANRVHIVGSDSIQVNIDTKPLEDAIKNGFLSNEKSEKYSEMLNNSLKTIEIPTIIKEKDIQIIEVPTIIKEKDIQIIQIPTVVKEQEIKLIEIEKPIYITKIEYIEKPIILYETKIVEIPTGIIQKEYEKMNKIIYTFLGVQTLAILLLIAKIVKG